MGALNLVIDRQSRKLVSYNGSITAIPAAFQGNVIDLKITVVDPTGSLSGAAYSKVNLNGYGVRVSIGAQPTGSSGGPTPLALQTSFTWDASDSSFSGSLECNTSAIDTHIGTSASATAWFEVNLTLSGNRTTILQETFTLKAVVDEATSTVPTPTDSYLTAAESRSTFQPRVGAAGDVLVLKSANGVYGLEIGVSNTGEMTTNVITL